MKKRKQNPADTLDVIITSLRVAAKIFEELKPLVVVVQARKQSRPPRVLKGAD